MNEMTLSIKRNGEDVVVVYYDEEAARGMYGEGYIAYCGDCGYEYASRKFGNAASTAGAHYSDTHDRSS